MLVSGSAVGYGCGRDVHTPHLPAPQYERPIEEHWPLVTDAGRFEVVSNAATVASMDAGDQAGNSDTKDSFSQ